MVRVYIRPAFECMYNIQYIWFQLAAVGGKKELQT